MSNKFNTLTIIILFLASCSPGVEPTLLPETPTATLTLTQTLTLPPTFTPTPTLTVTPTPIPFVESLKARIIKDKLICRYGPGNNYLYLFAFNINARIKLIGRTDGNAWVLVENSPQRCWVDSAYLEINGNPLTLHVMYPDGYKIPVSPYYGPTIVLEATRDKDLVTIKWAEVTVSPGKYEDEFMFPYIVEVWRCEFGNIVFETLGSRTPTITFEDQTGCDQSSHGRVYVQEKHGYAGPANIPWPEY